MKALKLRGKNRGQEVEISQWCNDWFSLMNGDIVSPSALAFKLKDFKIICDHKNNGMLFRWFEPAVSPAWCGNFIYTFKKKR